MEVQEVFDKVVTHMRKQNAQPVAILRPGSMSRAWAAGCLIEDEHYSSDLEYSNVLETFVTEALIKSGIPMIANSPLRRILQDLQDLHDGREVFSMISLEGSYPALKKGDNLMDYWEGGFKHIAKSHNLKVPAND